MTLLICHLRWTVCSKKALFPAISIILGNLQCLQICFQDAKIRFTLLIYHFRIKNFAWKRGWIFFLSLVNWTICRDNFSKCCSWVMSCRHYIATFPILLTTLPLLDKDYGHVFNLDSPSSPTCRPSSLFNWYFYKQYILGLIPRRFSS